MPNFEEKRKLSISMSEVDVSRDLFELRYICYGDASEKVRFNLEIMEWDKKFINIGVNFTDPQYISKGPYRDRVLLTVIKPEAFRSEESGIILQSIHQELSEMTVPK